MLKNIGLCFLVLLSAKLIAQTGGLNYVRNLGGSKDDMFWGNVLLRDGNLVSVGYTESNNGHAQGNRGDKDCFVVCTSPTGNILWKKVLGGKLWDGYTSAIDTTSDGNIVVGFTLNSSDGDGVGNHGSWDVAFLKYTPNGTLLWSKIYGGTSSDVLGKFKGTKDGGIIAAISSSSSTSGNVTKNNHGLDDLWVLKIDVNGAIEWQQLFGGSNNETGPVVGLAEDGGYFFACSTNSTDGDLANLLPTGASIGACDIWILHTDASGNILWQKTLGGSDEDNYSKIYVHSNSIYLGIMSRSSDRDLQGNLGLFDIALFKYNTKGILQWKKQYASYAWDNLGDIAGINGDMITICGGTYSNNFANYQMPVADQRMMIFRVDTLNGNIQWMKALGGNGRSQANAISLNFNEELFVSGLSTNTNGDIYANLGAYDAVLVKFDGGNRINGTVFLDANNNNILNTNEFRPSNITIASLKASSLYSITTTKNGAYSIQVDTGVYTITPFLKLNPYYSAIPDSFSHKFLSNNQVLNKDIALRAVSNVRDLTVVLTPLTLIRPGRVAQYEITGYNVGTTNISSGVIGFKKDSSLSFVGFSKAPSFQSGDSVFWNFTNLNPFDTINIIVSLLPPTTITGGIVMNYVTYITPIVGDSTPINNRIFYKHTVVNSYDPNCKTNNYGDSMPLSNIQNSEYIYYTIQFQNTGTASAIDIFIKDTLSNKLLDNTMEIIKVSHPYTFTLKNKIATWSFFNINLPDSNANEALSHGYIQFRIKAKSNLAKGDFIDNKAAIYFDFNPPVITDNNRITINEPIIVTPPTPTISPSGNVISCLPLVLTTQTGTGYQWYKNGFEINGAIGNSHTAIDTGIYTVTLTSNNITSKPSSATTISIGSINKVEIVKKDNLLTIINPDTTLKYNWQKLNNLIWTDLNSANGNNYTILSKGEYRVKASKGLCVSFSNSQIWEPISNPTVHNKIRIFPIPSNNYITIDRLVESEWMLLEIINCLGKKMITPISLNNQREIKINIKNFSSGVYLLILINKTGKKEFIEFVKK